MAQKKLRRAVMPLLPLTDIEEFLKDFKLALLAGQFDPYLYELVEAVDNRTSQQLDYSAENPDAYLAAFLRRVRHLRVGPPVLEPEVCYTLLGAQYDGVVVRYLEPCEPQVDKIRVEIVSNTRSGVLVGPAGKLLVGNIYRIPATAIDRQVSETEGI